MGSPGSCGTTINMGKALHYDVTFSYKQANSAPLQSYGTVVIWPITGLHVMQNMIIIYQFNVSQMA